MNGKCLNNNHKLPLKIFISNSKMELSNYQFENELHLQMQRLFLVFEKTLSKEELKNAFKVNTFINNSDFRNTKFESLKIIFKDIWPS